MKTIPLTIHTAVVDDLRVFEDCPFPDSVHYFRSLAAARALLDVKKVQIQHLWLDFDLGNGEDSKPFLLGLIGACLPDGPPELQWTVENLYIITKNPIGRKALMDLANTHLKNTNIYCVQPEDYGLLSKEQWCE